MEYQGIDLATGTRVFHYGPVHGTNNIGEFLAIVHALALLWNAKSAMPVYSDSRTARIWVSKRKAKTTLPPTPRNAALLDLVARAERWLQTHDYKNKVLMWDTNQWGEIPADFGRK